MEILTILLAAACIVCILFAFYWMREQSEIRREKRTGLTPPDGNGNTQSIVVPLDVIYGVERNLGEILDTLIEIQKQLDRVEQEQARVAERKILKRDKEEKSNAATSDTLLDNQ